MTAAAEAVGIVSQSPDLHAHAIHARLKDRGVRSYLIVTDRLDQSPLTWRECRAQLPTIDAEAVDPKQLTTLWWRRGVPEPVADKTGRAEFIRNEILDALVGILTTAFEGTWINDLDAGQRADNKLVQLQAARTAGFCVPHTLVSQDPDEIRRFHAELDGNVIVKALKGSMRVPTLTRRLTSKMLRNAASLRAAPAIYQECVPGRHHLRVCCFGDEVHAAMLSSDELDWRSNLNIPIVERRLSPALERSVVSVVHNLGLRMGILDLKYKQDSDDVYWLELNPQGQFLFLEGICGMPLTDRFCEFLIRVSREGSFTADPPDHRLEQSLALRTRCR